MSNEPIDRTQPILPPPQGPRHYSGAQGDYVPLPPPPPPVSRKKWHLIGYPLALMLGWGIGASGDSETTITATPPHTITSTVTVDKTGTPATVTVEAPAKTVTVKAAAPKPVVAFGEGDWVVGEDIAAGKYKTAEAVESGCYWGIYKSGTSHQDIIQNDLPPGGIPRVTLKKGQDFSSSGCGDWVKQ